MIKYRTWRDEIEAHDVLRETDKTVVLAPETSANPSKLERKEAKRSDGRNWHNNWDDAKAFLVEDAQKEVDSLLAKLERAKGRLGQIKGMGPHT